MHGYLGRYSSQATSRNKTLESAGVGGSKSPVSGIVGDQIETELERSCLVEELKLPEIMFPASDNAGEAK